jgi:hypothetical protein
MPLTLWVVMSALPLTRMFYERGQFHLSDSIVTARVLMLYGVGILPNAIAVILSPLLLRGPGHDDPFVGRVDRLGILYSRRPAADTSLWTRRISRTRGMTFFLVAGILTLCYHEDESCWSLTSIFYVSWAGPRLLLLPWPR